MLSEHFRVIGAERPEDALTHSGDGVHLVIAELETPTQGGLELLRMWKERQPQVPFLLITDGSDVGSVVEAMKLGAADCIVKPVDHGNLRSIVSRLLKTATSAASANTSAEGNGVEQKTNIDIPPGTSLEDLERAAVKQALAQHRGNRTHAAKTLGISVRTLQRKLKAWGMPVVGLPPSHNPARSPSSNSSMSSSSNSFLLPAHTAHVSFSAHAH
jgi:DNA-binding NtrC family response regulator